MRLNHLNLPVANVRETTAFFEKHFNFQCVDIKGDHKLAVLKGEDDFTLVLMSDAFNQKGTSVYPEALHIGFLVPEPSRVMELFDRLKRDQVLLAHEPRNTRGVFGFYFHAPGNILTEVSCPSQEN